MKSFLARILVLFSCVICLQGCRKYPENPLIEFNYGKNKTRLENTLWKFVKATIDGIDSTQQKHDSDFPGCELFFPENKDESVSGTHCLSGIKGPMTQGWSVSKLPDSPGFRMSGVLISPSLPFKDINHVILKLYKHEMKFKVTHPDTKKVYIYEYSSK